MTLDALIILAGALVAIMPFLGFPPAWYAFIYFTLGVIVVGCGIVVRRRLKHSLHVPEDQYKATEPLDEGEIA